MSEGVWGNFNIMLVDDEPITRHLLNSLLQQLGFRSITVASDGDEAIICLKESEYDLILTDIEMPGVNGLTLLQKIRCGATEQPRNTRVMVITSHDEMAVLGTAIALDADAIINKSIGADQLKTRIDHLLLGPQPELRPAIAYEILDTEKPLQIDASVDGINDVDGPGKKVGFDALVEGMLLAQPILSDSGYVLVPSGEPLTLGKIGLLQDLRDYLPASHAYIVD
ncbi:response regulator [Corallincola spongiicola]|uniref:Response regulator n=1 Tax=Corallincola spongiicola TaxID=2520508 RepID=A0ABY1WPW8_9GAMM|nr:response regulator [Corallincola spongiicola]TAA46772.1 response regulator [Corallincola spongiicola]